VGSWDRAQCATRLLIQHHLVLHKIDPERPVARFYSLMIERDLFGTIRPVRNRGRISTDWQEAVEVLATGAEARAKRRWSYWDL
jgi:predicted DNA-binding WGR domain protein